MKLSSPLAQFALAAALAPAANAQGNVWIVDDTGGPGVHFTILQDAIDAAGNGDVLLLKAGIYDPRPAFPPMPTTVDGKSLVILAEANTRPVVGGLAARNVGAGHHLTLRGFDFGAAVVLTDCDGMLWLEDCAFRPPSFVGNPLPLLVQRCAAVHLARCVARAGSQLAMRPAGLAAVDSRLHLGDCSLTGADGYGLISDGGDGAELQGGFLFASNTTFAGGSNGCAGSGLHLRGAGPSAVTLGCTFAAGTPGSCIGTSGTGVRVAAGAHLVLPGPPRSLDVGAPARSGGSSPLRFHGLPGDLVVVGIAERPASLWLPSLRGVFELLPPVAFHVLGVVPPGGVLQHQVAVPPLGVPAVTLFLQAAALEPVHGITLTGGSLLQLLAN